MTKPAKKYSVAHYLGGLAVVGIITLTTPIAIGFLARCAWLGITIGWSLIP